MAEPNADPGMGRSQRNEFVSAAVHALFVDAPVTCNLIDIRNRDFSKYRDIRSTSDSIFGFSLACCTRLLFVCGLFSPKHFSNGSTGIKSVKIF